MYILTLVFCLRGDPASCRPPVYPDMEPVTLMACVVSGQQAAARLLATEPELQGYALRRARCEPVNRPREQRA